MVLVAKAAGPTSHDVVDGVRCALDMRRVGHLGTLDPFAAGLLVLVTGRATRLAPFAAGWTKRYEGTILLGVTTDTDDPTGAVVATSEAWRTLGPPDIEAVLGRFRGQQQQRPPAHSAVKVAGEVIRALRTTITDPGHRFFLALLMNAPTRVDLLALVARRFPDEPAVAVVLRWMEELTEVSDEGVTILDASFPETLEVESEARPALFLAAFRHFMERGKRLPPVLRDLSAAEREAAVHGRPIPVQHPVELGNVALFADGVLVAVAERAGEVLKPRVVVVDA